MKKISLLLVFLGFIGLQVVLAQTRDITGTVTSTEDGSTVPGASVVVKGTTVGTVTDMDGKFTLKVPQGAKSLEVSFVGMTNTEVLLTNAANYQVKLEPENISVNEVVVTALGISKEKKALGYATQGVKSEELNRAANPSLSSAMQGKVAGVEVRPQSGMPGASSQIFIRGARFFSGNNNPLYVIDGLPIASTNDYAQGVTGTDFSSRSVDIDPNDIESINVLKGQAAAALYGMRASNGVIIITTKSGKQAKGKPVVTLTTNYTADKISRLPELQQNYGHGFNGAFAAVNSNSWGPKLENIQNSKTVFYKNTTTSAINFDGVNINPGETLYLGGANHGNPNMYYSGQAAKWLPVQPYNNAKEFFDVGGTTSLNLNVSQAGEMGNYSVGVGNTKQTGIIPSTGMDRMSFKATADMKMNDMFKVGFSANASNVSIDKVPSGNDSYLFGVFGAPITYNLRDIPYHIAGNDYVQTSYRVGSVGDNPYWATKNNKFNEATRRFFGNTYIQFDPVKWLSFKYQFGGDFYETDQEEIWQMGLAKAGGTIPSSYVPPIKTLPSGGKIVNRAYVYRNYNSLFIATARGKLMDQLNGEIVVGNELNDEYGRSFWMQGTGLQVPGWNNIANATTQVATESKNTDRTVGFFANGSLDWKGMLFLNATGRYDVVSSMPRNNRGFFYPSVSLGWLFTELEALKGQSTLSYGKLRGSYAEVGAAGTYMNPYYATGGSGSGFITDGISFPLGGVSGYIPTTSIYDPNLKPQNTKSYEIGFEARFFNNRIGIDYSYTKQKTVDQIFAVPLAGSTGYAEEIRNAGSMSGYSHEFTLDLVPVKTKDFTWNMKINWSKSESKCEELAEGVENITLVGFVDPNIRAYAGKTYPTIYGTSFLRTDKGELVIDDDDTSPYYGMPMAGGTKAIGNVTPNFLLGVNNTLSFKGLTLSFLIDWKDGGMMYSGSNRLINLYGTSAATDNRSTPFTYTGVGYSTLESIDDNDVAHGGTSSTFSRGGEGDEIAHQYRYATILGSISEANVFETSFVKLREVSLSYTFPKSLVSKIYLKGLSASVSARNILLWTSLPNFDPESSQGTGNGQSGFDYMSLPQTTSLGAGLTVTF